MRFLLMPWGVLWDTDWGEYPWPCHPLIEQRESEKEMLPLSPFDGQWRKVARVILKHPYTLLMPKGLKGDNSIFAEFESEVFAIDGYNMRQFLTALGIDTSDVVSDEELSLMIHHIPTQTQGIWEVPTDGKRYYQPDTLEVQLHTDRLISIRGVYEKGKEDEWTQVVAYSGEFLIEWFYEEGSEDE